MKKDPLTLGMEIIRFYSLFICRVRRQYYAEQHFVKTQIFSPHPKAFFFQIRIHDGGCCGLHIALKKHSPEVLFFQWKHEMACPEVLIHFNEQQGLYY